MQVVQVDYLSIKSPLSTWGNRSVRGDGDIVATAIRASLEPMMILWEKSPWGVPCAHGPAQCSVHAVYPVEDRAA